jgi:hypothetical protein
LVELGLVKKTIQRAARDHDYKLNPTVPLNKAEDEVDFSRYALALWHWASEDATAFYSNTAALSTRILIGIIAADFPRKYFP